MRRLTILRHAKSSWAEPGLGDENRPLNERGQEQCAQLARWMQDTGFAPDHILCSTATRTRETHERLKSAVGDVYVAFVEQLYLGSRQSYLDHIVSSDAAHLMVIGHNPTCDELVRQLSRGGDEIATRLSAGHFGTANLATMAFEIVDPLDIRAGTGVLETYIRPKDLVAS